MTSQSLPIIPPEFFSALNVKENESAAMAKINPVADIYKKNKART